MWEIASVTLVSGIIYASPVWWGVIDSDGRRRLHAVLNRAVKQGFLSKDRASIEQLCGGADRDLFASIMKNPDHVLHQFLPPIKENSHNLRQSPQPCHSAHQGFFVP